MSFHAGRWGVILDAGSSGTRLHIYRWEDPAKVIKDADYEELHSLPKIKTKKKWTKKLRPGVSTFGDHPEDVGTEHLQPLISHALDVIPESKHADTPIFLMATAGMRLLPDLQREAVLNQICSYFRENTQFALPDCNLHIQVIKGETEGLYGWIAANYLLGGFDDPQGHSHGKNHHTYGFLDMGGASAQIAFAPNATEAEKHQDDLKLVRMRTMNGEPTEYRVFTKTWLRYGVNQARERYVLDLIDSYLVAGEHEVPDPCMPLGLRTTEMGEVVHGKSSELQLVGTGDFQECLRRTKPILGDEKPCETESCLLNGHHYPEIDFDVNHFVGVSEYWHTTHGVFADKGEKVYDYNTYQKKVEGFCSQNWRDIESTIESRKKDHAKDAQEACFKASWFISMLHDGIGIPRVGIEQTLTPDINITKGIGEAAKEKGFLEPFQAVDKIDDIEVSWTLGKMLLYAAGQVPPQQNAEHLPVGFGSNVKGVPGDFQHAGSNWTNIPYDGDYDDWAEDLTEDLVDHVKSKSGSGFALFILILLFVAYIFRKRDRRMRLYTKVNSIFRHHHHRRPGGSRKGGRGLSLLTSKFFGRGSHQYERVLEAGDAAQFELGDVDSDEGDYSDSSGGSRVGRTSGLATPKLNIESFDDLTKSAHPGSAIDRSGLVVRTESRERLVPQMLSAGKRSRAGSPTRMKSPLMSPLSED
ncbi:GDA1/CD39 family protein [Pseudomassariella vexata]|uniref:GDA1/CD39 family protein n=1 Tax=Pseudomassariella vexata TaxID=1141098 RepID=A0A1Y2DJR2_9PEZI|nr:GDA1/CD39 family protein [Pseudomassariella vexata]ORY59470.1 GDA1/CD39 family protein [Pseudomassariella vexata]